MGKGNFRVDNGIEIIGTNFIGTGDGLSKSAAGELGIVTGGSVKMYIKSSYVGIGTMTPNSYLHIKSPTGTANNLMLDTTDTSGAGHGAFISVYNNGTQKAWAGYGETSTNDFAILNIDSAGDIWFGTNNTERMRIDHNGDVGLGTSPVTTLTIKPRSDGGGIQLKQNSGTRNLNLSVKDSNYARIYTDGTSHLALNEFGGNVGIGTTTPGYTLEVIGTCRISGNLTVDGSSTIINSETLTVNDNVIVLNNNVTGSPTENAGIEIERGTSTNASILWDETTDQWKFGLLGSEVPMISGANYVSKAGDSMTGNLNIAVNTGTRPLSLKRSAAFTGDQYIEFLSSTNTTLGWVGYPGSSNENFGIGNSQNASVVFYANSAEKMRIDPNGFVGIGVTNPLSEFHVKGTGVRTTITLEGAVTGSDGNYADLFAKNGSGNGGQISFRRTTADNNTDMVFYTSAGAGSLTERMRIASGGNIGIRTPGAPSAALDISWGGYQATPGLLIGADIGNLSTRTNGNQKIGTIGTPHYNVAEENILSSAVNSSASTTELLLGGGDSNWNAATVINFFTAATNTTVGGTNRMTITSAGYVGIGTTNPGSTLHLYNGTLNSGGCLVLDGNGNYHGITFKTSGTDRSSIIQENTGDMYIDQTNNLWLRPTGGKVTIQAALPYLNFQATTGTNKTYAQFLNTGGGALIGLEGSVAGSTFNGSLAYATIFGNDSARTLQLATNTTIRMTVDSAGNVGIGTSSPKTMLHVSNGFIITDNTYGYRSYGVGVYGDTNTEFIQMFHNASSGAYIDASKSGTGSYRSMYLKTGGLDTMVLASNGYVGIGTANPAEKLHLMINDDGISVDTTERGMILENNSSSYLQFRNPNSNYKGFLFNENTDSDGAQIRYMYDGTAANSRYEFRGNASEWMRIQNGNVGIGTSTVSSTLDVNGTITLRSGGTAKGSIFDNSGYINLQANSSSSGLQLGCSAASPVIFYTNGVANERMRIDGVGNVGIGLTNPSAKLHVGGGVNVPFIVDGAYNDIKLDTGETIIESYHNIEIVIDTSNNYGTREFKISHDASRVGGGSPTTLFKVGEDGNATASSGFVVGSRNISTRSIVLKNANYTVTDNDDTILVDASAGNVTITLLAVASRTLGRPIDIKKIDSSTNTVTIDGNGSETIDGALTRVISTQYDCDTVAPYSGAWYVI